MYKARVIDSSIGRGRNYIIVADSKGKIKNMVAKDGQLEIVGTIEEEKKALIFKTGW